MGFGFNLFIIFIVLPISILLVIIWLLTKKQILGKTLKYIWFGIIGLVIFSLTVQWLTAKTKLSKTDYYGTYIVNRNYFRGKQADWQYNSFRFEIKENDSIYFYQTDREKILKKYRGKISIIKSNHSARLIVNMKKPTNHIVEFNPTTYRSAWSFYLVFYSEKFNNVYFKKGKWVQIIK